MHNKDSSNINAPLINENEKEQNFRLRNSRPFLRISRHSMSPAPHKLIAHFTCDSRDDPFDGSNFGTIKNVKCIHVTSHSLLPYPHLFKQRLDNRKEEGKDGGRRRRREGGSPTFRGGASHRDSRPNPQRREGLPRATARPIVRGGGAVVMVVLPGRYRGVRGEFLVPLRDGAHGDGRGEI